MRINIKKCSLISNEPKDKVKILIRRRGDSLHGYNKIPGQKHQPRGCPNIGYKLKRHSEDNRHF